MKTLKELRESLEQRQGVEKDIMPAGSLRKVKTIARQISNASQPNIPQVITRIDEELRKYGYTLGEVDFPEDFDDQGEEDFAVIAYPEMTMVRNVYITVKWERTNSMIYKYSPDVLSYAVRVLANIVDPTDFDSMVGDSLYDNGNVADEHEMSESVEELEEGLSKARLRTDQNITVTLQNNTLRAQIKGTRTDIELKTKEDKKKLFTIFNLYDPSSSASKQWLKKHFTTKEIKEYESLLSFIKSNISESVEDLEEALRVKKTAKKLSITNNLKQQLDIEKIAGGNALYFTLDGKTYYISNQEKEDFIEKLTEFLLDV